MILSDAEIRRAIEERRIVIDPKPSEEQYTSSALDLHLGDELLALRTTDEPQAEGPAGVQRTLTVDPLHVDIRTLLDRYARPIRPDEGGSFVLELGKFVLGITHEFVELPRRARLAARVEGRSTLARLGLVARLTAPTIHGGLKGKIVLEMYDFGSYPLRLTPVKLPVCQLIFGQLGKAPKHPPRANHQGQESIR